MDWLIVLIFSRMRNFDGLVRFANIAREFSVRPHKDGPDYKGYSMRIPAFIQARMSSKRFPGKMLEKVRGKEILSYVVDRLETLFETSELVICTSTDPSDDRLETFGKDRGLTVFRGALDDVAGRFLAAAKVHGVQAFCRVCGDRPFYDMEILKKGLALFKAGEKLDLVTNTFPPTFPSGQAVEVVSVSALEKAYALMDEKADFEHVTRFFYAHPDRFNIRNFASERDLHGLHMSIDEPADAAWMASMLDKMTKPHAAYTLGELLNLMPKA